MLLISKGRAALGLVGLALVLAACEPAASLFAWGYGGAGQLGDGTGDPQYEGPAEIGTDTDWIAISAGHNHMCGLRGTGTAWCWGYNASGQLGDGTQTNRYVPTRIGSTAIDAATDWSTISASGSHTCGLRGTGTAWCWGSGPLVPTRIGTETDWSAISAGSHTCGLRGTGTLWCWGPGVPTRIGTETDWSAISVGNGYTCGVRGGTLWCWGVNAFGQLGDGTTTARLDPTQIGTATDWSAVSAANRHTCGLRGTGTLWCWGANGTGQLGDGTTTARLDPTQSGTATDWSAVSASVDRHTCGLQGNGTLWCWGYNEYGQVGDGSITNRHVPTQIGTAADWSAVSTGAWFSGGLKK